MSPLRGWILEGFGPPFSPEFSSHAHSKAHHPGSPYAAL